MSEISESIDNTICNSVPNLPRFLNDNCINTQYFNKNGTNNKILDAPMINNNNSSDSTTSNSASKTNDFKYIKSKKKIKSKLSNTTINYNIIHSTNIKIGPTTKHTYNLNNFQDLDHAAKTCNTEEQAKEMLPHVKALSNSRIEITKNDIFLIKTHVGNGWREVAKRIGYSKGQIEQFLEDHKYKGIGEVVYQILIDWKQSCTTEATIGQLICVMWSCQEYDCVERLVATHNKILNMK